MLSFQSGLSCFCPQLCFLWWKDTGNASRVKVEMTAKHTVAGYVWWWPWHTLTMKEYHRQFPQLIWEKWDEKRCAMKIAELVNRYKSVVSLPHEKADSTHVTVKVPRSTRRQFALHTWCRHPGMSGISELHSIGKIPLQLKTALWQVLWRGLTCISGKCLLNVFGGGNHVC